MLLTPKIYLRVEFERFTEVNVRFPHWVPFNCFAIGRHTLLHLNGIKVHLRKISGDNRYKQVRKNTANQACIPCERSGNFS